ncbi:MAG: hypothetical protein A2018_02705 [Alphaproteobacteria bacterium GWF2_58_20]|nr:MAG: hypothetical protein A2018_02705 [Alphaproteobacteria bacterium GWF2_58_20]
MNILKPVTLEHAPALFRIARAISTLMFVLPVVVLFYQYKGLTTGDFFLLQGIFAFAVFVLEVPTGYIGDLFSRKKVIVASLFFWCAGYFVWYLFRGFFFVFLGELLFGIAAALLSGTGEAYVFDVLKKQGKEDSFLKEWGKFNTWSLAGMVFATFTGSIIYDRMGPDFTALLTVFVAGLSVVLALFLPDVPEVQRVVAQGKSKWQDILDISKYAATHREIKWLMLYPATFGTGTLILMWGMQPLMKHAEVPVFLFGVVVGINQFFRMGFSHFAHGLFHRFKTKGFSLLLFGVLMAGLAAAVALPEVRFRPLVYILLVLVAFAAASQISLRIVTSSMINHRIRSDERATVLSVSSMFSKAFNGVAMITLKFMIDGWSLSATFAVSGLVILTLTGIALAKLLRLKLV